MSTYLPCGVASAGHSWLTDPGDWTLNAVADRVLNHVGATPSDPVVLAGHSTGGAIALTAALRHPEHVAGLILSNTGCNMHGHGDVTDVIDHLDQEWGEAAREQVLKRCFHYPPADDIMVELAGYAREIPKQAVLGILRSQHQTDLAPLLHSLAVPVVIAHGRHDEVRPIAHAEQLAALISDAQLRLLDAGHTPMLEAPIEYAEAVKSLLERIT